MDCNVWQPRSRHQLSNQTRNYTAINAMHSATELVRPLFGPFTMLVNGEATNSSSCHTSSIRISETKIFLEFSVPFGRRVSLDKYSNDYVAQSFHIFQNHFHFHLRLRRNENCPFGLNGNCHCSWSTVWNLIKFHQNIKNSKHFLMQSKWPLRASGAAIPFISIVNRYSINGAAVAAAVDCFAAIAMQWLQNNFARLLLHCALFLRDQIELKETVQFYWIISAYNMSFVVTHFTYIQSSTNTEKISQNCL